MERVVIRKGRRRRWRWNPVRALTNLSVLLFLAVVLYLILFFTAGESQGGMDGYERIIVQNGDTLWSLARNYFPNSDPRRAIFEIRKINSLEDPTIYPGQVLEIPR